MKDLARRARIKILYDNKDISKDLAQYLKSFSYNDVISGQADDLSITLEDRTGLWKNDWLPEKGATLVVSIITQAWWKDTFSEEELPLGIFEIDEIEVGGPPEEVKIKAVSVPNNTSLRGVDRTRAWEKTKLSVIANDIAKEAGLSLFYDTYTDPLLDRSEQTEQSDLSFLMKICNDAGLALKITDNKIVIFDEEKYEKNDIIMTITKGADLIKSYNFKSSTREIYSACHVKYQNSDTKNNIEYTFALKNKQGKTLMINQEVKTIAEAETLAKKKLREKNKEELTASFSLVGTFLLVAGVTINIVGFGKFDGKYIVSKASHEVGGGYSVNIDLRRCLDGY